MSTRHFLTLLDFTPTELQAVLDRAIVLKKMLREGVIYEPLKNRVLAMIFEKSSTRTRVSFEAGWLNLAARRFSCHPETPSSAVASRLKTQRGSSRAWSMQS